MGWGNIGTGRLLLTNERLVWQGPKGSLDFRWRGVTIVTLGLINSLVVRYGGAPYRFDLGQENALKWLIYAGTQARRAAANNGHQLNIAPF